MAQDEAELSSINRLLFLSLKPEIFFKLWSRTSDKQSLTKNHHEIGAFMKAKAERRASNRKLVHPVEVSSLASLDNLAKLAKEGQIIDASANGFMLVVKREALIPRVLRNNLSLDAIKGTRVILHLPQMNLEICGVITRTKLLGKEGFEIGIDFTADAPQYWRECLLDLLPAPGELDEESA